MATTLFQKANPNETCLSGMVHLLLHIKRLLGNKIKADYNPKNIPEGTLVQTVNKITLLLNNNPISGLILSEKMKHSTLNTIQQTLSNPENLHDANSKHLIQELLDITKMLESIMTAEASSQSLATQENKTLQQLHQKTTIICRELESALQTPVSKQLQFTNKAAIATINSFIRHMNKQLGTTSIDNHTQHLGLRLQS